MVTQELTARGEERLTRVAILATLAVGLLPLAVLFAIGLARAVGIAGFPPQFVNAGHPFWKVTRSLFSVSLLTLFASFLGTLAIHLSRERPLARNPLVAACAVGVQIGLLLATPLLFRVLTQLDVLHD